MNCILRWLTVVRVIGYFFVRSYDIIQFKTQCLNVCDSVSLKTSRMNDTENICREEFYWQFESAWVFGSFFSKESITDFCTYMLSRSCLFRMNNLHTPLEKSEIILKQNYTGTVWTWTFVIYTKHSLHVMFI